MSQFFNIHPESPQPRLIKEAAKIVQDGGVIVYPTDSAYALGCRLADKSALDRIRQIRRLDDKHKFTLVCRDLSELSTYAMVDNTAFRILKAHTPGAYTFILNATKEVPRRLLHPKRNTIGIRVPDNKVLLALLEELNEPLMSVTLLIPGEEDLPLEAQDINDRLGKQVDLIIDGGACAPTFTTIVDLVNGYPKILREGKGDVKNLT
jgi:tRNA threonylcarbamoyl adenosine modification protein (Sua5/YciO/YrdC/YwlC family)